MSSGLVGRIADAVKAAMRAHDSTRLGTLRLLQAAIKQKAIDEQIEITDAIVLSLIEKQAKQRRESIAAFEAADRPENAQQEAAELAVLQEFLPEAADAEEIAKAIDMAVAQAKAQGLQGGAAMGAVMGQVKKTLAGRVDLSAVSAQVRARLAA